MAKLINISGVIGWDVTAQSVREQLQAAAGGEVEVHISSPGGYISTGLEIFNLLRDYPGPISGVLKGYAMSMGSYIPLAIKLNRHAPGKLAAEDNAIYMIHNARGGVWGDHQEILGYGEALKGMSAMIAKAYARRTGKPLDELTAMMDKETYFFGDQILEHGFVDEIIETPEDEETDEQSARVTAQAMWTDTMARMASDQTRARADMQQAAAMLAVMSAPTVVTPPAAAGNLTQEVQQMNLTELLAANPAARTEYEAALATARSEGEKAGTDAVQARINGVAPFLANAAYPPAVAQTAIKVLKGEDGLNLAALHTVVACVDATREAAATAQATTASAQTPATPAAPATPSAVAAAADQSLVTDEATLAAEVAALNKGGN